jgi:mono/diheme cytochrome c family protein
MTTTRRFRVAAAGAAAAVLILVTPAAAAAPDDPAATFSTKCSSCHTVGGGDLIGPDLKGVTARRPRGWLVSWIRSSERMIRKGDPAAVALFRRYRQQQMPDHQLSEAQVERLLDYLAAGGPEAEARKATRLASTAGPDDVRLGRDLFFGRHSMAASAVACSSCHTIRDQDTAGGSLGPDLTGVYTRYQDKALSRFLERKCLPRRPAARDRRGVTSDESFALRAYLRSTELGTWADGARATSANGNR